MLNHDAMLLEGSEPEESSADDVRAASHASCPVCRADLCLADLSDGVGRENCPCDGEGAEPLVCVDGQEVCSEACRSSYEAQDEERCSQCGEPVIGHHACTSGDS